MPAGSIPRPALADFAHRVAAAVASSDGAQLRELRIELTRLRKGAAAGQERGICEGLLTVVDAAGDLAGGRGLAPQSTPLEPGSLAARLLLEIDGGVRGANADLADRLDTDQWQVSRAGRRLRDLGLATRVRSGRLNGWSLTKAGLREASRLRGVRA
jgi:hypothetical protein